MFRVYKTLTGARIAQAQRNRSLGFKNRVERIITDTDNSELELYKLASGEIVTGTYCIVEITVEDEEFERLFE